MFRLLKLAIYGILGYALYEFVRGMLHGETVAQAAGMSGGGGQDEGQGQGQGGGSRELNRALNEDPSRANITGPARGERVMSSEPSGESVPHVVGRGVVHR